MSNAVRKVEPHWKEHPSPYVKWLKELAESLRIDKNFNKMNAVNTLEGAIHEIVTLKDDRNLLMQARDVGSDCELVCKAFVKDVARWEAFTSYNQDGEVCTGGLRYATHLKDGIPVLHEVLRNALKRAIGYK